MTTFSVKKITAAKSKEMKTGCNLAGSSKEGCGSKRAVLLVMMMIIIFVLIAIYYSG
jgi:hypothetical protein